MHYAALVRVPISQHSASYAFIHLFVCFYCLLALFYFRIVIQRDRERDAQRRDTAAATDAKSRKIQIAFIIVFF